MAEETLDDNTRNEILKQVFIKPKVEESKTTSTDKDKIDENTDFATLLEKSIERRAKVEADEEIPMDVREEIIKKSNFNILKEWKF